MNWRTPITMVVLLGVLLGAAYYGWNTIVNPGDNKNSANPSGTKNSPTCTQKTIQKGSQIPAAEVRVNVYNAGSRSGLAGETLDLLVQKGFRRGVAENAPPDITTWGNATVILPGGQGAPQTRLVRNQFLGIVKYVNGPALAPGVDIVVGDNFRGVNPNAQAFVRVNRQVQACVETKGS